MNHHPEVACPPETNVSASARVLGQSWMTAHKGELPDAGIEACRQALLGPLNSYASSRGKRLWFEKSLCNAVHAEMLMELFPEARFVCLYRNCMDMVVSGVDACRWGYTAYGFEPYAKSSADNLAAAIVRYWIDHTQLIRNFERLHGEICYRLYYECLVTEPQVVMGGLLSFLGLEWSPDVLHPGYTPRGDLGFGDHKAAYSDQLDKTRIGMGHKVPIQGLAPALLREVNDLLVDLGYPAVGPDWNRIRSRLRMFGGETSTLDRLGRIVKNGLAAIEIDQPRLHSSLEEDGVAWPTSIRLIIEDTPYPDGDWCIDLRTWQFREFDDSEPGGVNYHIIAGTSEFEAIAERKLNIGEAIRTNDLRIFPTHAVDDVPYSVGRLVAEILMLGADLEDSALAPRWLVSNRGPMCSPGSLLRLRMPRALRVTVPMM